MYVFKNTLLRSQVLINYRSLKNGAHESYMLSKKSFVTICLRRSFSCAGDLSSDFGRSWHVSQKSSMFDNFGHE